MTVMILQFWVTAFIPNVDSSLKMAATKTNSYLEMEIAKTGTFLTSEVDQNNTTTIYQAYDTKSRQLKHPTRVALKWNLEEIKIEDCPQPFICCRQHQ